MIFLVQFGIKSLSTCKCFQRVQIALALRAHAILVVFLKGLFHYCIRNHVITYKLYTNKKKNCQSFVATSQANGQSHQVKFLTFIT